MPLYIGRYENGVRWGVKIYQYCEQILILGLIKAEQMPIEQKNVLSFLAEHHDNTFCFMSERNLFILWRAVSLMRKKILFLILDRVRREKKEG